MTMQSGAPGDNVRDVETAEVTIVTVVLEKHYHYIQQQLDLIDSLNPGSALKIIVIDNSGKAAAKFKSNDKRVQVVPGYDIESLPAEGRGSYHHAMALNKAVRMVDTPYVLVMDPDFFVLYPQWIDKCLWHMRSMNLWFFGAPWHYISFRKWRYFPCVHFLWVDLRKVSANRLDFTPAIVEDRSWLNSRLAHWLKRHAPMLHARSLIESRRDTGWLLRNLPGARKAAGVLQPVLSVSSDFGYPKHLRKKRGRARERLIPRRWRFLPAEGTYVELELTPEFEAAEFKLLEPEMFAWRGRPFAFHMRRNMRDKTEGRTEADALRDKTALDELLTGIRSKARV